MATKKPLALIILDGYGLAPESTTNAISTANTPVLDELFRTKPNSRIKCSGLDVGLPEGQMGNSEVGHTNIGAGRVVYQELTRITKQIADGDFAGNAEFQEAIANVVRNNSAMHLMGLLSDGGVHSHIDHIFALLDMCAQAGLQKVYVHCFLDGRDVPPSSGSKYIAQLERKMQELNCGKIATICGRYFVMDRDMHWDRLEPAYNAMVLGEGDYCENAGDALSAFYAKGTTDEFVTPTICTKNATISHDGSVIFANFRPDRAREITRAFVDKTFDGFARKSGAIMPYFVCFTQYDASIEGVHVAFLPQTLTNIFGEYISKNGLTQLRIAETEKYAHVTFFFNGGEEKVFAGEDRVLINSPKVATFDLQPEMSAPEVAKNACERIESGKYDVIILNFANCDMVGHTGILSAAVCAVEAVDACLGEVLGAIERMHGIALITADHGNADHMAEQDGTPFTAHTTNDVPLILFGDNREISDGRLCDLAPTMLDILCLDVPADMTGHSLLL